VGWGRPWHQEDTAHIHREDLIQSQSAMSVRAATGPAMPALLTRIEILSSRSSAASCAVEASDDVSQTATLPALPSSAATASSLGSWRPTSTTRVPARSNSRAMASVAGTGDQRGTAGHGIEPRGHRGVDRLAGAQVSGAPAYLWARTSPERACPSKNSTRAARPHNSPRAALAALSVTSW